MRALGLRVGDRPPFASTGYWLYLGDQPVVHLVQPAPNEVREPGSGRLDHVAFRGVDLDGTRRTLLDAGIPFREAVVPRDKTVQIFIVDPTASSSSSISSDWTVTDDKISTMGRPFVPPDSLPPPTDEAVRQHLERILASQTFQQGDRLKRFLTFIVMEAVAGRRHELKEYILGVEVFGKEDTFDPRNDPIVRVQARRLRAKLVQYYAEEGRADDTMIELAEGWLRAGVQAARYASTHQAIGDRRARQSEHHRRSAVCRSQRRARS